MLTATLLITDANSKPDLPRAWKYAPADWAGIEKIFAPDLSPRERYLLDRHMQQDHASVIAKLGFPISNEALEAYNRYHRFYPTFQSVSD